MLLSSQIEIVVLALYSLLTEGIAALLRPVSINFFLLNAGYAQITCSTPHIAFTPVVVYKTLIKGEPRH